MRRNWFGVVAIAILIGVTAGVLTIPQASATPKYVDNDSLNTEEPVVIDVNMTLDATVPVETTSTDTTITKTDLVEIEQVETPELVEIEDVVDPTETVESTKPSNEVETESHDECNHLWKFEYMPPMENKDGYWRYDCVKCGEWYIEKTIPCEG